MLNTISPPAVKTPRAFSGKALASAQVIGLVVAGLLGVGLLGLVWYWHSSQYEQTDNASLQGHIHPVAARIPGTITTVLVDDDIPVQKGQLLAIIDDQDYQLALAQAEHEFLNAKVRAETAGNAVAFSKKQSSAQLTQALGGFSASRAGISQVEKQLEEAQAAVQQSYAQLQQQTVLLHKAQSDFQRYQGVNPDAVSAQQRDAIETQLKNAQAAEAAAASALKQSQARAQQMRSMLNGNYAKLTQSKGVVQGAQAQGMQVRVSQGEYEAALVAVKMAEDKVRQARLNLSYTRIVSPVTGRIGKKTVEVGQRIQAGEPLMAVVSPELWVVANYKETQLRSMRPGQPVEVEVDAFPQHHFKGVVASFSPAAGAEFALLPAENATGNFTKIVQRVPVKILLSADTLKGYEQLLVPGMSTLVTVNVGYKPDQSAAKGAGDKK
ncbi:HlyD family secretion protein [Vampirovibrio chlorellavorus]|uniref:HlyD family secretion protein n=1 Tax=Vampirovibrio chlorellavorus TaxID=758823 RepID=UPI0026EF8365|nr:HlyD family secretion protein [Vampirovibrio chlorellavorus]